MPRTFIKPTPAFLCKFDLNCKAKTMSRVCSLQTDFEIVSPAHHRSFAKFPFPFSRFSKLITWRKNTQPPSWRTMRRFAPRNSSDSQINMVSNSDYKSQNFISLFLFDPNCSPEEWRLLRGEVGIFPSTYTSLGQTTGNGMSLCCHVFLSFQLQTLCAAWNCFLLNLFDPPILRYLSGQVTSNDPWPCITFFHIWLLCSNTTSCFLEVCSHPIQDFLILFNFLPLKWIFGIQDFDV